MLVAVMFVAIGCSKENLVPDEIQANGGKTKKVNTKGDGHLLNLSGTPLEGFDFSFGPTGPNSGGGGGNGVPGDAECLEFYLSGINAGLSDPIHNFTFHLGGAHLPEYEGTCLTIDPCQSGTFQGASLSLIDVSANPYTSVGSWNLQEEDEVYISSLALPDSQYELWFHTSWEPDNSSSGSGSSTSTLYCPPEANISIMSYSTTNGVTGSSSGEMPGSTDGGPGGSTSIPIVGP